VFTFIQSSTSPGLTFNNFTFHRQRVISCSVLCTLLHSINTAVFIMNMKRVYCAVRNDLDYFSFLGAFAKLGKATISFVMSPCTSVLLSVRPSVRMDQRGSTRPIFVNLVFQYFSKNMSRGFKFYYDLKRIKGTLHEDQFSFLVKWIKGTLHEDQFSFLVTYHLFILRMRNVSYKICRENQNTLFTFSRFIRKSCLHEIMSKTTLKLGKQHNMAHARCVLDN
jgi:hypothetical protein